MITVWELNPAKKEVASVPFHRFKSGGVLNWVDCYKPSTEELEAVSSRTGIPFSELSACINPNKRSHVVAYKNYSLILFRGMHEEQGRQLTVPIGLFLFRNNVVTIHDLPIKSMDMLRKLPAVQLSKVFRNPAYFALYLMDVILEDFFPIIEKVGDEIDAIEEQVVNDPAKVVTKKIFLQKRMLIYINKSIMADRDVISSLERQYLGEFHTEHMPLLSDLNNDAAQLLDLLSTYRDILTSVLDMHISSVSNNLNRVMKTLTALSAFVLIPTLISGIYGMNFQHTSLWNMPELYWNYGYFFALGLMVLSILATFIWFKVKDWL